MLGKKALHMFALFVKCGEFEMSYFFQRVIYIFGSPQVTDAENILEKFLSTPYDAEDDLEKIGPLDFEEEKDSTDSLDEVDENTDDSIHGSSFNIEAIRQFPLLSGLLDIIKRSIKM